MVSVQISLVKGPKFQRQIQVVWHLIVQNCEIDHQRCLLAQGLLLDSQYDLVISVRQKIFHSVRHKVSILRMEIFDLGTFFGCVTFGEKVDLSIIVQLNMGVGDVVRQMHVGDG